jgi:hypothetical protein
MPDKTKIQPRDLTNEALLGMLSNTVVLSAISSMAKALPAYIDDAERDFGLDIYERMKREPALSSSLAAIKYAVLSEGVRFVNSVDAPSAYNPSAEEVARHNRGEELRVFIEDALDNLQQPIEEILEEMLDYLPFGHQVAEQVYEAQGSKYVLSKLRVKPRRGYAFVVDNYLELQGLVGSKNGRSVMLTASEVKPEDIIPRSKFWIISNSPVCGDPRGCSVLRPAYNAWYLKQQTWPQYLKYLAQFGTPSIAGKLPENAGSVELVDSAGNPVTDIDGNPLTKSAATVMLEQLINFANGTAIVLDHGAEIDLIQSEGDGSAYTNAVNLYDKQMVMSVIVAVRATLEAEHGSKADSGTAQDILGQFAQFVRRRVEMTFYRDVIVPLVRYNFGDDAVELAPYMSLSDVAREDVVAVGNMIASLAREGLIHHSQYQAIDAKLGLPERDYEAQLSELEAQQQQSKMLDGLMPMDGIGGNTEDDAEQE